MILGNILTDLLWLLDRLVFAALLRLILANLRGLLDRNILAFLLGCLLTLPVVSMARADLSIDH